MQPFIKHDGLALALERAEVDTDQLIPKQFLKAVTRSGFGDNLFHNWRYDLTGREVAGFELNHPRYQGASVLLARGGFGGGSSREHAAWALADFGFKVVIAESFADIFRGNCLPSGILPVALEAEMLDEWFKRTKAQEGYRIKVDLEAMTLTGSDGFACTFTMDPVRRQRYLRGLDDIGLTLEHEAAIAAYEKANPQPWRAGGPNMEGDLK